MPRVRVGVRATVRLEIRARGFGQRRLFSSFPLPARYLPEDTSQIRVLNGLHYNFWQDTFRLHIILPEVVVQPVEHTPDVRDLLVRVQDAEDAGVGRLGRWLADSLQGVLVARPHPVERVLSFDILEPLSRVGEIGQRGQRSIAGANADASRRVDQRAGGEQEGRGLRCDAEHLVARVAARWVGSVKAPFL
jgi:hypothetical protein